MLPPDRDYAFGTQYPNGRDDNPDGANPVWISVSGIFDLFICAIYLLYDGAVYRKPCQIPKNGKPDPVRWKNIEFCIRYDVRPWFANSHDYTVFLQWRGVPKNHERHYRRRYILDCDGNRCCNGNTTAKNQKGGGVP